MKYKSNQGDPSFTIVTALSLTTNCSRVKRGILLTKIKPQQMQNSCRALSVGLKDDPDLQAKAKNGGCPFFNRVKSAKEFLIKWADCFQEQFYVSWWWFNICLQVKRAGWMYQTGCEGPFVPSLPPTKATDLLDNSEEVSALVWASAQADSADLLIVLHWEAAWGPGVGRLPNKQGHLKRIHSIVEMQENKSSQGWEEIGLYIPLSSPQVSQRIYLFAHPIVYSRVYKVYNRRYNTVVSSWCIKMEEKKREKLYLLNHQWISSPAGKDSFLLPSSELR